MKQRVFALTLLLCLMSAGCQSGVSPTALGPPSGDIIIASDLPVAANANALSGERAIRLAISEHPTVGHGRFKLAYWSLDDSLAGSFFPETAIENVNWMIEVPKVLGMIGPGPSAVAEVTIPVANSHDLVMISPSTTRFCLTQLGPMCRHVAAEFRPSGHINFFRLAPPDPTQGLAMARYAVTHLGVTRVAVINEWGSDGRRFADRFTRELLRLGGQVVSDHDFDPNTHDFQKFLVAAQTAGAQAVYALGGTDGEICLVRAQLPTDMLFLGTDGFAQSPDCLAQAANRTTSIIATTADVDITAGRVPGAAKEIAAFQRAYPGAPIGEYAFASYDAAVLLITALEQAIADAGGVPSRAQVLAAVAHVTYPGLTGTYAFDENGDARAPLMEIYDVEDGKWVNKGKIDATAAPPS